MEGSSGRPAPARNAGNAGRGGPARAAACDDVDPSPLRRASVCALPKKRSPRRKWPGTTSCASRPSAGIDRAKCLILLKATGEQETKPLAASGGSIVANFDVLDDGEDAAGRTSARLLNLAIVALGLGVIGALAFAWSNADGPLRFELQSAAAAPKSAQRAAAQEKIERLRGELDALKNDVKELTETQHQAAHTIAAMKAAEEDLRRHVPPPYWFSNPATLDLAVLAGFKDVEKTADLTEGGLVVSPDENSRRAAALRKMLAQVPEKRKNTFLITHKPNIIDALGKDWFDVKEGEASIFKAEDGKYRLVARVQMEDWPKLVAVK